MSVNKVILVGNLGADPDLRSTTSGQSVCELRLATSEKWTDKQGEKQEKTEWHRVILWDKAADNAAKYLEKGRQVYVEGKIETRTWDDKDGNKRYTTEIRCFNIQYLGGKSHPNSGEVQSDSDLPF